MEKKTASKQISEKKIAEKQGSEKKPLGKQTASKQTIEKNPNAKTDSEKQTGKKKMSRKKKRALRRKRIRLMLIGLAVFVLLLSAAFHLTNAVIGGQIYPLSTQSIDLRNRDLSNVRAVTRLKDLREALLTDNGITDVSALSELTECEYIDLTGNPVSDESYAFLRNALPSCLILCEAADSTTTEMALSGYTLPNREALMRVFESHSALETVDLRGTDMAQEDITALCERFPHIDFIYQIGSAADTLVINIESAGEAAEAIGRVGDAAHITVTGCTFTPDEYSTLRAQFPETTLDCLISLYGKNFPSAASDIDLSGCTTDEKLEENLRVFSALRTLTLSEAIPSKALALKAALSLEELRYKYNGFSITPELTEIDLNGAQGLTGSELELLLEMLPNLQSVLMSAPEDETVIDVIRERKDSIRFVYEAKAFGQTFDAYTEIIDLGDAVTDADAQELAALIKQLPSLKEALMYDSKLSEETMDMLFYGYPDVFFGWTVSMCDGKYVFRTDITAFSTQIGQPVNYYTEEHLAPLRYCKRLEALDLGHNNIYNIDFLYGFPDLKVLILVDNKFTDITPIASLTQLEYLEIFMNNGIRDFTPLADLPLKHLNICFCGDKENKVTADVFMGITTLERFWASRTYFDKEEGQRLSKALPNCTVSVTYGESTGDGWRRGEIYPVIVRMFETGVYESLP